MDIYQKYSQALETAIGLIRSENLDPTQALQKTAEILDLERPGVEYVANQINNSRVLVHMATTSGEGRLEAFPLADASKVKVKSEKKGKKTSVCKKAEAENPFMMLATSTPLCVSKAAQAEPPCVKSDPFEEFDQILREEKALIESALRLHSAYGEDVARLRNRCSSTSEVIIHTAGSDDFYQIQRTFPPGSKVRTSVEKLKASYESLKNAEQAMDGILHLAGTGFASDFLANSVALEMAKRLAPSSSSVAQTAAQADLALDERKKDLGLVDMSPITAARLGGLRTRKVFMDAVFTDPNLRGYPLSKLVQAFNDTVQTDPSVVQSPPRIRAGMMQMLQSSVLDPFQLGQMVDTGKKQQAVFKEIHNAQKSFREDIREINDKKAYRMAVEADTMQKVQDLAAEKASKNTLGGALSELGTGLKTLSKLPEKHRERQRELRRLSQTLNQYDPSDLEAVAKASGFKNAYDMKTTLVRKVKDGSSGLKGSADLAAFEAILGLKTSQEKAKEASVLAQEQTENAEAVAREKVRIENLLGSYSKAELDTIARQNGFADGEALRAELQRRTEKDPGRSPVSKMDAAASALSNLNDLSKFTTNEADVHSRDVNMLVDTQIKAIKDVDPMYIRRARQMVEEDLLQASKTDPSIPDSLTRLADKALSPLNPEAGELFALKLAEMKDMAKSLKFADSVASRVKRTGGGKLTPEQTDALRVVEFRERTGNTSATDPAVAAVANAALRQYEAQRLVDEARQVERGMRVRGSLSEKQKATDAARAFNMSYSELLSTLAASEVPADVRLTLPHAPDPAAVRAAVEAAIAGGDPLASEYQDMLDRAPGLVESVASDGASVFKEIR